MKMDTSSEPVTGDKRTRRDVSPEKQHAALAKRTRLNLKSEDADEFMPPGVGYSEEEEDDEDNSNNLRHLYTNDSGIEDDMEDEGEEFDSNYGDGYTADVVLTEADRLHFRGLHFEDDEPQIENDAEDEIDVILAFDEDIRSKLSTLRLSRSYLRIIKDYVSFVLPS